jgi:hypothetical protein
MTFFKNVQKTHLVFKFTRFAIPTVMLLVFLDVGVPLALMPCALLGKIKQ